MIEYFLSKVITRSADHFYECLPTVRNEKWHYHRKLFWELKFENNHSVKNIVQQSLKITEIQQIYCSFDTIWQSAIRSLEIFTTHYLFIFVLSCVTARKLPNNFRRNNNHTHFHCIYSSEVRLIFDLGNNYKSKYKSSGKQCGPLFYLLPNKSSAKDFEIESSNKDRNIIAVQSIAYLFDSLIYSFSWSYVAHLDSTKCLPFLRQTFLKMK